MNQDKIRRALDKILGFSAEDTEQVKEVRYALIDFQSAEASEDQELTNTIEALEILLEE